MIKEITKLDVLALNKMMECLKELKKIDRIKVHHVNFVTEEIIVTIDDGIEDNSYETMLKRIAFCGLIDKIMIVEADFDNGELKVQWLPEGKEKLWGEGLTKDEIKFLIAGKPIECIKAVRQRTGMGLADAKKLVENARHNLRKQNVI